MRTFVKAVTVQTPDLHEGSSVEFKFYSTPGTHPTPGGHEKFRLVATMRGVPMSCEALPSVMYSDSMEHLDDVVARYAADDTHDEYPDAIDWYDDEVAF